MDQLIITCDDYGFSESTNYGAIELYNKGLINNVSIMSNCDSSLHGLDLLVQTPGLKTGIHLDLLEGHSLTGLTHTVDPSEGYLQSRFGVVKRMINPSRRNIEELRGEFREQIDVLVDYGFSLEHLTTHLHFHVSPVMRSIIRDLGKEYGAKWIRNHSITRTILPYKTVPKNIRKPQKKGMPFTPDYLVPLSLWVRFDPEYLVSRLHSLPGSTEIVVHIPNGTGDSSHKRIKEILYLERFVHLVSADK